MKKAIFLVALAAASTLTFAQVEKVKEAKKKASSSDSPDFVGAKAAIDAALQDPSTKNSCETWYIRGFVNFKMFDFEDNKRFEVPPGTLDVNIQSEAAYNAYNAWMVADSLDVVESTSDPKRKGKLKYRKEMAEKLVSMKNYLNNYGSILFNNQDYSGAAKVFEVVTNLPNLEMFKGSKEIVASDSMFYFANENAQLAYIKLFGKQQAANDTVGFLGTLNYGMKKYPNNPFFLVNKIEYSIRTNNAAEAMANIEKAIQIDPNNPMYYYVRGYINSANKDKQTEAKADFEKALSLKPEFPQAIVGLGTIYFDAADIAYNRATFDIKDAKAADAEMKRAEDLYKQVIPYYEKARSMKYDDPSMLQKLQGIYRKLKMYDKEKEIKAARGF